MKLLVISVIFCLFGTLVTQQPNIDREKSISSDTSHGEFENNNGKLDSYQPRRSNDRNLLNVYDNSISEPIKVYQPREDPRLFYLSDSYIEEVKRKKINKDITEVFPENNVVRAKNYRGPSQMRVKQNKERNLNRFFSGSLCVKCPHDRTLVARPGSDRVFLEYPPILTCSNAKPPRGVHFVSLNGPKPGSLLEEGSHVIIGRIYYRNEIISTCKIQVQVLVKKCQVPSYLISKCDNRTKLCLFTCREKNLEMIGPTSLMCGDNMGWSGWTGNVPACRPKSWCVQPSPPDQGHLNCKGTTIQGKGLTEGSTCHIRCRRGWHWNRKASVCRRGLWTHELTCQPKRRRTH